MPERIEEAVYGGLTRAEQDAIEAATPRSFAGPEQAIAWGLDCGAFYLPHSRNAYDKLKREQAPKTAGEMWDLWIADCLARTAVDASGEAPAF